jgi:HSP20 family molecular chaperone IbpA
MSITYSKLFEDWNDVLRELNGGSFGGTISSYPHVLSNENEYTVELPLVGIAKEELKIHMELVRGVKYITIDAQPKVKTKWVTAHTMSYALSDDANIDKVDAKLENGLLTVKIPKIKPEKRSVKVDIV